MKVKIYLDTSVYNRPFDDQGQTRIRLETEAFLSILEKAISGAIIIINSSVLIYENSQNPFAERKERISNYLAIASKVIRLDESIKKKAISLESLGIEPIDALHLAYADAGGAEYFLTCDDSIIKKAKKLKNMIKIDVCSPLEFILKEVFKNA
ncbi:MAG: PIN domain-containing protein [Nitrospirota bacterium]